MKKFVIYLIKLYQKIPGPWHDCCKYQPTCSNYAIGVINEMGLFRGLLLTFKRIIKCNPFSKGGYDPVPVKEKR